jgi:hypothetical protein
VSANVISIGGCLKKPPVKILFPQAVFVKQPVSANVIFTDGFKTTASEKTDFYWSLALAALKTPVQIALELSL